LKSPRKSRHWRKMFRLPNNFCAPSFARFLLPVLMLNSCRQDDLSIIDQGDYPAEVATIIQRNCSVTGCHTSISKEAAGGISTESWAEFMQGGNNGNAYVVPFAPDQSPFIYIINDYEELGPALEPRMPYNFPVFSKERVQFLIDWVEAGAPNAAGDIAFEDYQDRSMIYALNSKCGKLAVIDEETGLVMRYVDLDDSGGGFVEVVEVAPDGEYFYVVHYSSGIMKKFKVGSNAKVGEVDLGSGFWRSMTISPDSKTALVANWSGNSFYSGGDIEVVDLQTMSVITTYDNPNDSIYFPIGITTDQAFTKAYVSCGRGNFIYEIDISDILNPIVTKELLEPSESIDFDSPTYLPGEIVLTEDEATYFVVCEGADELRAFNESNHTLLASHIVGNVPQDVVISELFNVYAVSCMEDQTSFSSGKGSVVLFDLNTHTEIKRIYSGYQPRALVVNKDEDYIYVFNRNADPVGADVPHHYSGCEGNNGYVTIIDLGSMELLTDYKAELNVDPFSAAIKK
jgi:DNA-binding beta-propeller fold protein YncE